MIFTIFFFISPKTVSDIGLRSFLFALAEDRPVESASKMCTLALTPRIIELSDHLASAVVLIDTARRSIVHFKRQSDELFQGGFTEAFEGALMTRHVQCTL